MRPLFLRGLRQGWRGLSITAAALGAMLLMTLATYSGIDLSLYDSLPEAARNLMGVPSGADAATLAYSAVLGSVGALAFVGVSIAVGAHYVAGEEGQRTLQFTLSAPVSRLAYGTATAVALLVLVVGAAALLWVIATLSPMLLGVETGESQVWALMLHLGACALFHASLAYGIGAASGRKSLGAGLAALVMVVGWLAAGLLPLWPDAEDAVEYIPWYWLEGSKPLVNGPHATHLSLLLGGAVLFAVVGVAVFVRRELRAWQAGAGVLGRLARISSVQKLLAPTSRGATLFGLRFSAGRALLTLTGVAMFAMLVMMGPLYAAMQDTLPGGTGALPEEVLVMFGGGTLDDAAGFLHLEMMGLITPIAVILVATAAASGGLAGEEQARRMSLLLAQPRSRSWVYWTVAAVMVSYVAIISLVVFAGLWITVVLGGFEEPSVGHIAETSGLTFALGLCFGGLAMLLSAASGRRPVVAWGTTATALAAYFGNNLLTLAGHEQWAWLSPFKFYLHGPPLVEGVQWWQPTVLLLVGAALLAVGPVAFGRRDLQR